MAASDCDDVMVVGPFKKQIYSEHQKTTNAFHFQMLVKKSKMILQYWQVDGKR